jgi:hypothetical protein
MEETLQIYIFLYTKATFNLGVRANEYKFMMAHQIGMRKYKMRRAWKTIRYCNERRHLSIDARFSVRFI